MFNDSKCQAQTVRCYNAVARYDGQGVKSATRGIMYMAFINNDNIIYECDKNGNAVRYMTVLQYKYIGSRDGKYIYKQFSNSPYGGTIWTENYLYFTQDFKRLNNKFAYPGFEYTVVYEMGNPGDEIKSPDTFY